MRNLVKYAGIGLLVMGLAACDNNDTKKRRQKAPPRKAGLGQRQLMDGKLSFAAGGYDIKAVSWSARRIICAFILTRRARKR